MLQNIKMINSGGVHMKEIDIIIEGAKVSKNLISAVFNNSSFTTGYEFEFFYVGIDDFMNSYMKKGSVLDSDDGWYAKRLGDTRWHDVIMFFYPLDASSTTSLDNYEIMKNRLLNAFDDVTDFDPAVDGDHPTESEIFSTLRSQLIMPVIMALLKIYPYRGMKISESQERSVKSVIQRGDVKKAATLGKLDNFNYRTFEDGMVDQALHIKYGGEDIREIFYEIFAFQLQKYLGEKVMYSSTDNNSEQSDMGYLEWMVLPDGSLVQDEQYLGNVIGIEIVSPIMSLGDGLTSMQKIFNIITDPSILGFNAMEGKTTFDTGFHINLGLGHKPIDYVKLIMLMGDRHTLEQYGRWTTEHAEPILANVVDAFNTDPAKAIPMLNQLVKTMGVSNDDISNVIKLLKGVVPIDKFNSVNLGKLEHGYIEFRAVGGADYHKDFDKIRNTVLRLAVWMYVATEPEIYKNEYYKSLVRFIRSIETGTNEFLDDEFPERLNKSRQVDNITNLVLNKLSSSEQQLTDSTGTGMHVGPTGRQMIEPTGYMDSMWVPEPENSDGHHPGGSEDDLDLP